MEKIPVRSVYGQTYCHESEDLEKVKKAFELFFPKKDIKQETKIGAYGTKVKILSAEIKGKKARNLIEMLLKSLSTIEKNKILNELKLRLSDEGKFYLRFDKQSAYKNGKIILTNGEDAIQIILSIEAYPANNVNYLKSLRVIFS